MSLIKKLSSVPTYVEFIIDEIFTDEDTKRFLFSLGCCEGEPIISLACNHSTYIVAIKNNTYSIDKELADNIYVRFKEDFYE